MEFAIVIFGFVSVAGARRGRDVELLLDGFVKRERRPTPTDTRSPICGQVNTAPPAEGLVDKTVAVSLAPLRTSAWTRHVRSPVEGLKGFISDLDLTHSLMIVPCW
jgi:hypothetical protein